MKRFGPSIEPITFPEPKGSLTCDATDARKSNKTQKERKIDKREIKEDRKSEI